MGYGKNILGMLLLGVALMAFHSCCPDDKDIVKIPTQKENKLMPIVDWSLDKDDVEDLQIEDYMQISSTGGLLMYEYVGDEDISMSYSFDSNDSLVASAVMLPSTSANKNRLDDLLQAFSYTGHQDSICYVYISNKYATAAMRTTGVGGNGNDYLLLCFTPYAPAPVVDYSGLDYIDLGLSVMWAKNNVGASAPEDFGSYYAWSETSIKYEYWRENYAYADNSANKYVFKYDNPYANITGTGYDVARWKMGDEWRMPTREEVLELIYGCTWERAIVNDVEGSKVTGPNGNSIFIPNSGYRKQDRDESESYETCLWTSEAPSKYDESAWAVNITRNRNSGPELVEVWKAWGLPVRAVRDSEK